MQKIKIETVYSGGGCYHYQIDFSEYGLTILIDENNNNLPKEKGKWNFCVYDSEMAINDGKPLYMSDQQKNFCYNSLITYFEGFILGQNYPQKKMSLDLDSLDYDSLAYDLRPYISRNLVVDQLIDHDINLYTTLVKNILLKFSVEELQNFVLNNKKIDPLDLNDYILEKKYND